MRAPGRGFREPALLLWRSPCHSVTLAPPAIAAARHPEEAAAWTVLPAPSAPCAYE
jgi:hypothetical protein